MTQEEGNNQVGGKVNLVELATGLLILGKFEEVFKLCQKGLGKFTSPTSEGEKKTGNAHPGVEVGESPAFVDDGRVRKHVAEKRKHRPKKICFSELMKECLCIIAVQALVEMNRCQDVVPFLQTHYGPIQQFPPRLVQLCMVLNVHLNKHQEAEQIYSQYSSHPMQRISNEDHTQFIEIFFTHVLFPQEKWTEAAKIIETDQILKTDKKLALLKVLKEKEKSKKRKSEVVSNDVEVEVTGRNNNASRFKGNILFLMASKVSQFVCRWIPKTYWRQLSSLAVAGVCAYLVLLRYNTDISTSQSYVVAMWFSFTRLCQTMFSAYYKIDNKPSST